MVLLECKFLNLLPHLSFFKSLLRNFFLFSTGLLCFFTRIIIKADLALTINVKPLITISSGSLVDGSVVFCKTNTRISLSMPNAAGKLVRMLWQKIPVNVLEKKPLFLHQVLVWKVAWGNVMAWPKGDTSRRLVTYMLQKLWHLFIYLFFLANEYMCLFVKKRMWEKYYSCIYFCVSV